MVTPLTRAWDVAAQTPDPELPMLTIADLGILRAAEPTAAGVTVTITPTYSGCPALTEIQRDVRRRLTSAGYVGTDVRVRLAPSWSSDWITAAGRAKLMAAGIAPPSAAPDQTGPRRLALSPTRRTVGCPRCGSHRTRTVAEFSATSCRALMQCEECQEPFEYVKEI